jgi:hypothetical protein
MLINEVVDPYKPTKLSGKADELVARIQAECGQMLAVYQKANGVLWRGIGSIDFALHTKIRPDRRPVEMPPEAHKKLELAFNMLKLPANRTNSIFCSCNPDIAAEWGRRYVIFVKDGWKGTVFDSITSGYFFDSFYYTAVQSANTPEILAAEMEDLGPRVIYPQNLDYVLKKGFEDILITGDSYYAIRHGTRVANQIFNALNVGGVGDTTVL